jgi:hypothetical protein
MSISRMPVSNMVHIALYRNMNGRVKIVLDQQLSASNYLI